MLGVKSKGGLTRRLDETSVDKRLKSGVMDDVHSWTSQDGNGRSMSGGTRAEIDFSPWNEECRTVPIAALFDNTLRVDV